MSDLVSAWTSLPNLHPALVHFPVALVPAAWAFDLTAAVWSRQRSWLARAATVLWGLAALGAGAAYRAGRGAADSLVDLPPRMQAYVATHSDWGLYTLWTLALLAVLRIGLSLWDRDARRAAPSAILAVVGLAAVGMVAYTADLGGGLVYRHGVAVTTAAPGDAEGADRDPANSGEPADSERGPSDAAERLVRAEDGTVSWRPRPGDEHALGTVVDVVTDEGATLQWTDPGSDAAPGLLVDVEGRALLLLPGRFGDVQVEAEVAPEDFDGVLGLAHHVRGLWAAGLMTVALPAGEFALATVRGPDDVKTLDRATRALPPGSSSLAVSATGRHLRGTLAGEVVVHGHEPPLPEGRAGLLLDGSGRLRILEVRAIPIQ